ncbi:hypothetical protein PHYBLDRAFT_156877 [Phycomyces blakesleeanus NRRL 1555(-)]|uniref:Uncharacterized protein n=2 Tax=Phycomyces blakesleeanus TaxID=4837 RepID=A0A167QXP0_PHYB8|nr:hypothetical protein PHYBLDRAFT_156877 [Phycomyces blakesleeanus NRRL 1555(-)]OAD80431.1 hypothetical protein PHYBLDRAFT_156877 [Phycomyces blakesleeanus NRRL 1555(-)]|eukprot:XP_018298471.1 hypothetical protein PHYBLDRAFT_156877 [Phycomyces blakesleeanus NRRL 1555(-)]
MPNQSAYGQPSHGHNYMNKNYPIYANSAAQTTVKQGTSPYAVHGNPYGTSNFYSQIGGTMDNGYEDNSFQPIGLQEYHKQQTYGGLQGGGFLGNLSSGQSTSAVQTKADLYKYEKASPANVMHSQGPQSSLSYQQQQKQKQQQQQQQQAYLLNQANYFDQQPMFSYQQYSNQPQQTQQQTKSTQPSANRHQPYWN